MIKLTDWCTDFVCYNQWPLCPNSVFFCSFVCWLSGICFVFLSICPSSADQHSCSRGRKKPEPHRWFNLKKRVKFWYLLQGASFFFSSFKIIVLIFLVFLIRFYYVLSVCSHEAAVSEAWNSRSCKCDCEGGESPTEFSSIGTGSSMVRGVDCMPGTVTPITYSPPPTSQTP